MCDELVIEIDDESPILNPKAGRSCLSAYKEGTRFLAKEEKYIGCRFSHNAVTVLSSTRAMLKDCSYSAYQDVEVGSPIQNYNTNSYQTTAKVGVEMLSQTSG